MIVKKTKKPAQAPKTRKPRQKDWRDALRLHLAKVPTVDAVFVNTASDTVHVYSIVERFRDESCGELMAQDAKVEKAFPKMSFEFHTRPPGPKSGRIGSLGFGIGVPTMMSDRAAKRAIPVSQEVGNDC